MTTDTMRAAVGAMSDVLMNLADEAIHAYGAWLAEFIAGELPSHHAERLNAEKDAAREKLRLAIAALEEGGESRDGNGSAILPANWVGPTPLKIGPASTAAPKEEGEPSDDAIDAMAMRCCGDLRGDRLCMTRDQRLNFARKVLATRPIAAQPFWCEKVPCGEPRCARQCMMCAEATRPIAADTQGDAKDAAQRLTALLERLREKCAEEAEAITEGGVDYFGRTAAERIRKVELDIAVREYLSPSLNEGKAKEDQRG